MPPFVRKLIAVAILIATGGAAAAQQPAPPTLLQVYAIRGLAGVIFSRGLNNLCDEIARIPQVACTVEDFYDESEIEEKAAATMAAGQRLVLVGHSLGAHAALNIAGAMKGPVPLIVTIDPNWYPPPPAVPENAELVLNYYQNFDVLGRATLQPPPDFQGKLYQYSRSVPHILIERSPEIHATIIARIKEILASIEPPPLGHILPPFDFGSRAR